MRKDRVHERKRILRAATGSVLTLLGVFVAVTEPAGHLVALFLVGVGCGMIDPALVSRTLKAVIPRTAEPPADENP